MLTLRSFLAIMAITFAFMVTACGTTGQSTGARDAGVQTQSQTVTAYKLGSSDRLRVSVFGQPELSGELEVDGTGAISMPLIGQVAAVGLSRVELENAIAERLADGYVLDPRVSVEVINYRPFYILGEVGQPGEYPYTSGLTVRNAVAAAGGFTYRANKRVVYIKGMEDADEVAYDLTASTVVKPGDTIRIGERIF